eukprot:NODE_182_length_13754_cov_0.678067.p9 type:complete len:230 gc:universal NODE_182_length_13754_cov_0.678067:3187-3876(+)
MNLFTAGLIFAFIICHLYIWSTKKTKMYISMAHLLHLIFMSLFLICAVVDSLNGPLKSIMLIIANIESFELLYPFIFKLKKHILWMIFIFSVLEWIAVGILAFKGFQLTSLSCALVLSIFIDLLYTFRPIKSHDTHVRFFAMISAVFCLYQIFILTVHGEMIMEMYMVVQSGLILSLNYIEELPMRGPKIPSSSRHVELKEYPNESYVNVDIPSPVSATRRGFRGDTVD